MRFPHIIIHLMTIVSTVICDFKIGDCNVDLDGLLDIYGIDEKSTETVTPVHHENFSENGKHNSKLEFEQNEFQNTTEKTHLQLESKDHLNHEFRPNIYIYLFINGINNLDYLSNVFDFQFSLVEIWRDVNLNLSSDQGEPILLKNIKEIDMNYPTLDVDETDFNAHQIASPIDWKNEKRPFKHYYYVPSKRMLIKSSRFNLQSRCQVNMQNFPFIHQPCNLNIRRSKQMAPGTNLTICNMNKFINKQFNFNKFDVEISSLNRLCDDLNQIEKKVLRPRSCFRLLITFRSNRRLFFTYFLVTFILLFVSYLSLWVPIYNHSTRIAFLTLPIIGQYLFDRTLLKNDKIMFRESTSLHIWHLACTLYIGFNFFCYILAFYSLDRVKVMVEKADIGYLGYMLKSANLVHDGQVFANQMHNFDRARKYTTKEDENASSKKKANIPTITPPKTIEFAPDQIGSNFKNVLDANSSPKLDQMKSAMVKNLPKLSSPDHQNKKIKTITFKEDQSTNMILSSPNFKEQADKSSTIKKTLPAVMGKQKIDNKSEVALKSKGLKPQISNPYLKTVVEPKDNLKSVFVNSPLTVSLKKELDDLKRELMTAQNDLNMNRYKVNKKKKKTLQVLNNILSFNNPNKGQMRKKKIVSRFISSSKLKKIEIISLIPSDRYARLISPISFSIFFYFFALHFIF